MVLVLIGDGVKRLRSATGLNRYAGPLHHWREDEADPSSTPYYDSEAKRTNSAILSSTHSSRSSPPELWVLEQLSSPSARLLSPPS